MIPFFPAETLRIGVVSDGPDAYQIEVYGCNGRYSGYAQARYDRKQLEKVGRVLAEFPAQGLGSEALWQLESWGDEQPSSLRFFIHDRLGHATAELRLATAPRGVPDSAHFVIDVEVATINRLGTHLLRWAEGWNWHVEFVHPEDA
jgi:hypothetical protein